MKSTMALGSHDPRCLDRERFRRDQMTLRDPDVTAMNGGDGDRYIAYHLVPAASTAPE
jgi:hypothetical protein